MLLDTGAAISSGRAPLISSGKTRKVFEKSILHSSWHLPLGGGGHENTKHFANAPFLLQVSWKATIKRVQGVLLSWLGIKTYYFTGFMHVHHFNCALVGLNKASWDHIKLGQIVNKILCLPFLSVFCFVSVSGWITEAPLVSVRCVECTRLLVASKAE